MCAEMPSEGRGILITNCLLRNKDGDAVSDKDNILSRFKEYFEECLEEEISEIGNIIEGYAETSLKHESPDEQYPRTMEEVGKRHQNSGQDSIPSELFNNRGNEL
jgi:hypothetical protein